MQPIADKLREPLGAGQSARIILGPRATVVVMIAVIGTIDLVWSVRIGLTIGHLQLSLAAIAVLGLLSLAYQRRSRVIADTTEVAAMWIALSAGGGVLSYLAATLALPLQDGLLSSIDHKLGFDWASARYLVARFPEINFGLKLIYASLIPQILLIAVVLPAIGMTARCYELLLIIAIAIFAMAIISGACPAIGPLGLALPAEAVHMRHLLALRSHGPWHFELPSMQGIVTMPSFHTVLAVLFAFAFRGVRYLGWIVGLLNCVMLLSVVPIGGHYLVDLLAGVAISIAAIVLVRQIYPELRARRQPRVGQRIASQ